MQFLRKSNSECKREVQPLPPVATVISNVPVLGRPGLLPGAGDLRAAGRLRTPGSSSGLSVPGSAITTLKVDRCATGRHPATR
jgi:hypothetical protein